MLGKRNKKNPYIGAHTVKQVTAKNAKAFKNTTAPWFHVTFKWPQ
jgi:hypothetical protein